MSQSIGARSRIRLGLTMISLAITKVSLFDLKGRRAWPSAGKGPPRSSQRRRWHSARPWFVWGARTQQRPTPTSLCALMKSASLWLAQQIGALLLQHSLIPFPSLAMFPIISSTRYNTKEMGLPVVKHALSSHSRVYIDVRPIHSHTHTYTAPDDGSDGYHRQRLLSRP